MRNHQALVVVWIPVIQIERFVRSLVLSSIARKAHKAPLASRPSPLQFASVALRSPRDAPIHSPGTPSLPLRDMGALPRRGSTDEEAMPPDHGSALRPAWLVSREYLARRRQAQAKMDEFCKTLKWVPVPYGSCATVCAVERTWTLVVGGGTIEAWAAVTLDGRPLSVLASRFNFACAPLP